MPAHGTETAADNTGGQKGDLHPYDGQADDSGKALSLLYEAQAVLCDLRSRETVFSKLTEKRKVICMKTIPKKTIWYPILFILLIGLIAFLSFYKLDVKYVDPWDEARHGVNAYEMANGGSLIQSTYMRQADYYNLKPPLSMYGIMLGMAIFGNTVFALRFYAALSYVLLALCVGLFAKRYGKLESLLAVAFLAVNTTAFQAHMIRSGDADSLYVLLFTLAMICMMKIRENGRYSYAFSVCTCFSDKELSRRADRGDRRAFPASDRRTEKMEGKELAAVSGCCTPSDHALGSSQIPDRRNDLFSEDVGG